MASSSKPAKWSRRLSPAASHSSMRKAKYVLVSSARIRLDSGRGLRQFVWQFEAKWTFGRCSAEPSICQSALNFAAARLRHIAGTAWSTNIKGKTPLTQHWGLRSRPLKIRFVEPNCEGLE
jgi:hypothetical protein